jgi:hypothetical protein
MVLRIKAECFKKDKEYETLKQHLNGFWLYKKDTFDESAI